jgi:LemA protein
VAASAAVSVAALEAVPSAEGAASVEVAVVRAGSQCPFCRGTIERKATYCPHCGKAPAPKKGPGMKFTQILLAVVLLIAGTLAMGGCYGCRAYNQAITLDQQVENTWAEVENQLQRRFDLIPNIIETVKGVAAQEKDIFLGVAEARKAYTQAQSIPEKARAAGGFESALSRLLVIQERYPELRSNEAFAKLMDSLEGTENRLTVARKRYNDTVTALNGYTRRFPSSFFASFAGVEKAEYFEVPEAAQAAPKVDFSSDG